MKRPYFGGIGSVSSGTMRTEDLIPSFLWEAKRLRLTRDERTTVKAIERRNEAEIYDDDDACDDLDELFSILDAHSLPYFYFGAHPGDGADYGWWLSESFEESFSDQDSFAKVDDLSDVPRGFTGEVLHTNDHGNISLYRAVRGRLYECWSVV